MKESLEEALRKYADRETGYIYADEVAVLREAAAVIEEQDREIVRLQAERDRYAARLLAPDPAQFVDQDVSSS